MKFRKKPVVIEAIQWNGNSNKHEIEMFIQKELKIELESETAYVAGKGAPIFSLLIETLEGIMRANAGDWIIKGVNGEYYPCKPDIFQKTYELADYPSTKEDELAINFAEWVVNMQWKLVIIGLHANEWRNEDLERKTLYRTTAQLLQEYKNTLL